jgi:hypothetical protein
MTRTVAMLDVDALAGALRTRMSAWSPTTIMTIHRSSRRDSRHQ